MNKETINAARKISARLKPSRKWEELKPVDVGPDPHTTKRIYTIWANNIYTVTARAYSEGWPLGGGEWVQLGIYCEDGEPRHDWRDFQRIKNQLVGPEWEAIELYPAESRLLDPSNYYLIYCAPKIPIGKFEGRRLMAPEHAIAPQRAWAKGDEPKDLTDLKINP